MNEFDGRVVFCVAPSGESLLSINPDGAIYARDVKVEPQNARPVVEALRAWIVETAGEPKCAVLSRAGDLVFGVPAAPDALRLCDDGRILVFGDQVGAAPGDWQYDRDVYLGFAAWLAGSKITLPNGQTGTVDMLTPLDKVDQTKQADENIGFTPSDHKDGVRFRFVGGLGKTADRAGGDVVFKAGVRRAELAAQ